MITDLTKSADRVADYFVFLFRFAICDMRDYVSSAKDEVNAVHGRLVLFVAFGVGLAYIFVLIGGAVGMADDKSKLITVISRIDMKVLPGAVLAAVLIVSVLTHVALKLASIVVRVAARDSALIGEFSRTLNAGFAFSAWIIPVWTLPVVLLRIASLHMHPPTWMVIALVLPVGLTFWFHFSAVLAAAHDKRGRGLFSFLVTLTCVFVVLGQLIDWMTTP